MEKMILLFEKEKETKRTVRYKEVSEHLPPVVGTLYVNKKYAADRDELFLTIEEVPRNDAD